jgi:cyclopropane fatty-acyl-phospholipid synthase-like methyltransferase
MTCVLALAAGMPSHILVGTSMTPAWLKEKICRYYSETTEPSYLANWAGRSLGFHFGIGDDSTASLDESLANTNSHLADRLQIGPGTRVLDAGCGVGGSSIWLARERGAQVTAITLAPIQVELGRRFARERGVADKVTFECVDFTSTPFSPASFDCVWNIESLCHCLDARSYLEHVWDLLDDGGRFGCVDLFRGAAGDPAHADAMCEGWVLPALQTIDALANMLREIGFVGVTTEDLTSKIARSADALHAMAHNKQLELRAEEVMLGKQNPIYRAHVNAALGAVAGMKSGSVTYGYVGAIRPSRAS